MRELVRYVGEMFARLVILPVTEDQEMKRDVLTFGKLDSEV